ALAGNVEATADLVLIAPATANTIGKAAAAIDDTPVTTVITTALGQGLPLLIVPAMHEPMYRHPLVAANIERLKEIGVEFVMPRVEEGKAKISDERQILDRVIDALASSRRLRGKRFLVTAGRTVEYLDPVRVITNNSSGKMGIAVAQAAAREGAEVTLLCGKISVEPPKGIRVVKSETSDEMAKAVSSELDAGSYDVLVAAAAVGDWKPAHQEKSKISTHTQKSIEVTLVPTTKIIDSLKSNHPELFLVAFRALTGLTPEELVTNAHQRMMEAGADLIAVNEVTGAGVGFESDTNELYIVDRERAVEHIALTTKREAAARLVKAIARRLTP
ncbi:MAG TPA: bifunctional phosphopantothenoylcysteine decarboxylase/phosphopantothenate--cysteine ligase CoaBC, partial [Spirochaetia bacterium]|nr:bifunctional phosphopantothenoylcysteine decarboxylase/phosphopantothenate--cysteine ligase CoaBC [Spirochaetia bacterium]